MLTLSPSRVLGTVFLVLGAVSLSAGDWSTAAIWGALGAGMVLLEGTLGSRRAHHGAPSRRNRVAAALLAAAVVLFVAQVALQR